MRDDIDRDRRDYDDPPPRRRPRPTTGGGMSVLVVLLIVGGVGLAGLVVVGILVALLVPAVSKVRGAANRVQASNSLKQIGLAMYNYHDQQNSFPPPYLKTKDGRPGLSWRVAILPYLGGQYDGLYRQFKLDEPWDSPTNLALLGQMPIEYAQPGEAGATTTHFRVFVGGGTLFDPNQKMSIARITDGSFNTIMAVESADAVPWTKPDDLDYRPGAPLPPLGLPNRDVILVLFADGSVKPIRKGVNPRTLQAAITANGGEAFAPEW